MTKKEIKTVASDLITDYITKGNQLPETEQKARFVFSAFSIVDMLAELNMLNDEQIANIKKEIYEGIYD